MRWDCATECSTRSREPGGSVDVAFTRAIVAVLVEGCFWHRCPTHGSLPKSNYDWWLAKLGRNVERDHQTNRLLIDLGWTVLRFWERDSVADAARQIAVVVRSR
jgi:DNA mismatch endonuclease (patch repair protein)